MQIYLLTFRSKLEDLKHKIHWLLRYGKLFERQKVKIDAKRYLRNSYANKGQTRSCSYGPSLGLVVWDLSEAMDQMTCSVVVYFHGAFLPPSIS